MWHFGTLPEALGWAVLLGVLPGYWTGVRECDKPEQSQSKDWVFMLGDDVKVPACLATKVWWCPSICAGSLSGRSTLADSAAMLETAMQVADGYGNLEMAGIMDRMSRGHPLGEPTMVVDVPEFAEGEGAEAEGGS